MSGAVYHCQQAFEKTLKGFLTWHAYPFQRTHNLPGLLQLCDQVDAAFSALASDAALLTPYATQFRYPPILVPPTESDAADALRAARGGDHLHAPALATADPSVTLIGRLKTA